MDFYCFDWEFVSNVKIYSVRVRLLRKTEVLLLGRFIYDNKKSKLLPLIPSGGFKLKYTEKRQTYETILVHNGNISFLFSLRIYIVNTLFVRGPGSSVSIHVFGQILQSPNLKSKYFKSKVVNTKLGTTLRQEEQHCRL